MTQGTGSSGDDDRGRPPDPAGLTGPVFLNYRPPRDDVRDDADRLSTLAVLFGLAAGGGACAAGWALCVATFRHGPAPKVFWLVCVAGLLVAVAVVAARARRRPGWRGFGLGTAIGLILGLLLLVPCAGIYLSV